MKGDTRVLVTGAAGFIGRHTVAALRSAGHAVRVYVRRAGYVAPAPDVEVAIGHMNDPAALRAACTGCTAVRTCCSIGSSNNWRAARTCG